MSELGSGELPTLKKLDVVRDKIKGAYFKGQNPHTAKKDAFEYANALIEDSVFNPNYYREKSEADRKLNEEYGFESDVDFNEEELKMWQGAVNQAEDGDFTHMQRRIVDYAVSLLQEDPDLQKLGASLVNLAFSLPSDPIQQ